MKNVSDLSHLAVGVSFARSSKSSRFSGQFLCNAFKLSIETLLPFKLSMAYIKSSGFPKDFITIETIYVFWSSILKNCFTLSVWGFPGSTIVGLFLPTLYGKSSWITESWMFGFSSISPHMTFLSTHFLACPYKLSFATLLPCFWSRTTLFH